jgi:hypothetical protein
MILVKMSTAAKDGNGGAAMLPVQRKRHVRLLSNVQPEKRRDVSCWPVPPAAGILPSRQLSRAKLPLTAQPGARLTPLNQRDLHRHYGDGAAGTLEATLDDQPIRRS